jgi:acyl-CoA synthetase (AMP-forming)/AMP-acid ligase II
MADGAADGTVEAMNRNETTTPAASGRASAYWPADSFAPLLPTTIGSILRTAAGEAPGRVALIDGGPDPERRRTWTYGELLATAERAARALLRRFSPGEPVAVWSANSPQWLMIEFAAGLAGLVLVPVNPAYQAEELAHVLGHSGARGIFLAGLYRSSDLPEILASVRGRLPELREVIALGDWDAFLASADEGIELPDVDPASPAQVLYTSGTTGIPKGAVLTHRGLTNNARLAWAAADLRPGKVAINPMPFFHVAGAGMIALGLVQYACTQVIPPYFEPGLMLELTETYRSVLLGGVPTMLHAVLDHPAAAKRDLSSVRLGMCGGAPVPASLVRRFEDQLGVPLLTTFAQTESSCSITVTRPSDTAADRAETVGRPLLRTEVKIVSVGTGEIVPFGEVGEILVRGYLVMDGYLGDPAATSAAIDDEGWLRTGDLGSMDERGYLRIRGRVKEMIIRGGENVYPREIEDVLLGHPAVAQVAVVGVASTFWGEEVGAVISPAGREAPEPDELREFCRQRLAAFKVPAHWMFLDSFPLTATGKVRKDVLSARFAGD